MESWVQSWRPRTNAFCICSIHLSKLLRLPGKMMLGHTKCCTCHAKSSQQTWRSDAPKCNPSQEITRRFSEPTFRPSGATNHWKNTVFCDFPTFSRTCIFFLLTLSLLWSSLFYSSLFYSSLLSDSSHLCFSSVHIVGSLTSKLPLMNLWTIADFQFTDGCWFCTNSWASVGENPPLMGFLPSTTSKMAWQQPWWMLTGFPSRSTKTRPFQGHHAVKLPVITFLRRESQHESTVSTVEADWKRHFQTCPKRPNGNMQQQAMRQCAFTLFTGDTMNS